LPRGLHRKLRLVNKCRQMNSLRPALTGKYFNLDAILNPATLRLFFLIGVIAFFTAYPVTLLFLSSFQISQPGQPIAWGLEGWRMAFSDPSVPPALWNTFILGVTRVAITTVLSVFFAWVITRTDTPGKGFIEFMLWLGFFLPLLPMTLGWILLLDPSYGIANKLLVDWLGLSSGPFNIYSYSGIIWVHLAFSTCVRFMLLTPAFRALDATLEEAAHVAGSSAIVTLARITVPVLMPAVLATTMLAFIKSLESLEVEIVLGVPARIFVYSTLVWDYAHFEPPAYHAATALSSVFLLTVFGLIWLQRIVLGTREFTTVGGRGYSGRVMQLGRWRWVTFGFSVTFIAIMIALPMVVLLMGTFMKAFGYFSIPEPWTVNNWSGAFNDPILLRSLRNTLILGIGAGGLGGLFYAIVGYNIVRSHFLGRQVLDFLVWLPWALPGVLISLALLWATLGIGKGVTPIYGTIYLLVLAIMIKELPLGTQISKASVMQIGKELEESSSVSGASGLRTFRKIVIPLMLPAILATALVVFVSAVRDIPVVLLLSSPSSRPLSLLMLDYMMGAEMERATVIGVFVVLIIVAVALLVRVFGLRKFID
jgi:iron(III) transport system permease protein